MDYFDHIVLVVRYNEKSLLSDESKTEQDYHQHFYAENSFGVLGSIKTDHLTDQKIVFYFRNLTLK